MVLTATMARVKANVESADISAAVLSRLSKIPQSSLKEALQGARYLGAEREKELLILSARLAEIMESLNPLTVQKGDSESLQVLIDSHVEPSRIREWVSEVFGRE
jgi:hypothetical protein